MPLLGSNDVIAAEKSRGRICDETAERCQTPSYRSIFSYCFSKPASGKVPPCAEDSPSEDGTVRIS
jgi:hypothetical protein